MLSLVIPIFNEEKVLNELLKRTIPAIESFSSDFELIFVDDGSSDNSLGILLDWQQKNSRIKILSLSKNFGHQAAYTAGLEFSRGDHIAMMDGDLQDPPEILIDMFRKITVDGYDIVSGKKIGRRGKKNRNIYALLFHILFRNIGDIKEMENYGNFSMLTRRALSALLSMREKVRYLPGMRTFIGFRQGYVEYIRDDRYEGLPKMNMRKLLILASDAIFSFSKFPLRLCLLLGILGTIVFMIAGIYVIIAKIYGFAVIGWSSTVLSIYFLGSIQLLSLGVLGEYIYRNYKESQNRPVYFVRKYYDNSGEKQ
jgi:glycosyltransferase involved in cell wall biosynthesis